MDHNGRVKQPCCIGSADTKSLKPICEDCGLGCYSVLVANGITGAWQFTYLAVNLMPWFEGSATKLSLLMIDKELWDFILQAIYPIPTKCWRIHSMKTSVD